MAEKSNIELPQEKKENRVTVMKHPLEGGLGYVFPYDYDPAFIVVYDPLLLYGTF